MKTNIRLLKVLYIFLLIAVYNPLLANTMPGTEKITSQNQGVYNMAGDISF